jgi:hypothetical protein
MEDVVGVGVNVLYLFDLLGVIDALLLMQQPCWKQV